MGSCCKYSALERYVKKHGEEDVKKYEEILVGKKIMKFNGTHVSYWIEGSVTLDDGSKLNTHMRWSSMNECQSGIENYNPETNGVLYPEDDEYCTPM